MFDIFQKNKNFCDTSIKPWIFLLIFSMVLVSGMVIYQNKTMEPEDLAEDLSQKLNQSAAILTDFSKPLNMDQQAVQPSIQEQNKALDGITQATPLNDRSLVWNNSREYLQSEFKRTIASVRPSVVNIKATKIDASNTTSAYQHISSFENVGSGIVVSGQGHILTNYHVIANANRIVVSVYGMDRQHYLAKVIDHHVDTDLSLLILETQDEFKPAELGDSDFVETGDIVLAIGNPFGFERTVTSGIISGIRKTLVIDGRTYRNMIQTDAPINRGSSGGPLVNLHGEVIGINTAIYAPTGVFNGTGFAMPINRVKRFLAEHNIVPPGSFVHSNSPDYHTDGQGWLGVEIQSVDRTVALHLGLPYIGGALINRVIQNSPAWVKGLERGDVILEFDGRKVSNIDILENLIVNLSPAETVKVLAYRDKKYREFYLTLSNKPASGGYFTK